MVGVWRDICRFTDADAWIDYLCIIERLTLKGMAPCLECHAFCHRTFIIHTPAPACGGIRARRLCDPADLLPRCQPACRFAREHSRYPASDAFKNPESSLSIRSGPTRFTKTVPAIDDVELQGRHTPMAGCSAEAAGHGSGCRPTVYPRSGCITHLPPPCARVHRHLV